MDVNIQFVKTQAVPPSFLSMDVCGRVIRLDSLSKVISAGLRAAWMTAPTALLYRAELHAQAEILHSCTLAQVSDFCCFPYISHSPIYCVTLRIKWRNPAPHVYLAERGNESNLNIIIGLTIYKYHGPLRHDGNDLRI